MPLIQKSQRLQKNGRNGTKHAKTGTQSQPRPDFPAQHLEGAYVFFASDADSSFITGQILPVLGGSAPG